MNRSLKIKKMVMITILSVLAIVLQLFSNYVQFGPVSITLSLIPIVVGAILYGPLCGFVIGAATGLIVFVAPATIALFWPYGVFLTFLVCILKMGIAGFVSGLLYKLFSNRNNKLAVTLSSVIVPLVNTGLFALAAYIFYYDLLAGLAPSGQNVAVYLFLGFIGFNFLIELFVNSILSPVVLRLANMAKEKFDMNEIEE